MNRILRKRKKIDVLLILFIISQILNPINQIYRSNIFFTYISILDTIGFYCAVLFVIIHAIYLFNFKNGLSLILLIFMISFLSEYYGVTYGYIFGSYEYNINMRSLLGVMSIRTPFSWCIIVYLCFLNTKMILSNFLHIDINTHISKILISILNGLIAMNIDMILDPVAVKFYKAWSWSFGGNYYDFPIINFIGWFLVTTFCTLIILHFYSNNLNIFKKEEIISEYTIILSYASYLIKDSIIVYFLGNKELILIGIAAMGPVILINALKSYLK